MCNGGELQIELSYQKNKRQNKHGRFGCVIPPEKGAVALYIFGALSIQVAHSPGTILSARSSTLSSTVSSAQSTACFIQGQ